MQMDALLLVAVLALVLSVVQVEQRRAPAPSINTQSVDLRPRFDQMGLGLKSQGARGTCSVFAVTAALEYALAKKQGHGVRLSEEFLNWASNKAIDDYQDGGFFHDLWKGYEVYGICAEECLPYAGQFDAKLQPSPAAMKSAEQQRALGLRWHWIKRWNVRTGLTDSQFERIKAKLQGGWPVCAGLRWPKRVAWANGVLNMAAPDEVFDGHSILLVGYKDDAAQPGGGVFYFKNSGDGGGWFEMPYAFARAYTNDAGWVDATSGS